MIRHILRGDVETAEEGRSTVSPVKSPLPPHPFSATMPVLAGSILSAEMGLAQPVC